jgi:hypothetical protein
MIFIAFSSEVVANRYFFEVHSFWLLFTALQTIQNPNYKISGNLSMRVYWIYSRNSQYLHMLILFSQVQSTARTGRKQA